MTTSTSSAQRDPTDAGAHLIRAREIVADVAWQSPAVDRPSMAAKTRIQRAFVSGDNDGNIGVRVARDLLPAITILQSRLNTATEALAVLQAEAAREDISLAELKRIVVAQASAVEGHQLQAFEDLLALPRKNGTDKSVHAC